MLSVVMLSVIMLSVIMLSVIMLSVIMLSAIMLNATYMPLMLGVVLLIVVAPFVSLGRYGTDSSFTQVLMLFYNFEADWRGFKTAGFILQTYKMQDSKLIQSQLRQRKKTRASTFKLELKIGLDWLKIQLFINLR